MTFAEIEKLCRKEISDDTGVDRDKRVSPWQMLAYANEAENEACIRARLLVDSSTTAICSIAVEAGTSVYAYDSRIIFILRARMAGSTYPLNKVSRTIIDDKRPGWEDETGEVECLVTGMNTGKLTLYRNPSTAGTLGLTVARRPLRPMTDNNDSPEINASLHPALIYWIKHKVFNNQDSELFDKNRADVHLAMFEQKFGQKTANPHDVFDAMELPRYIFRDNSSYHASDGYY